MVLEIIYFSYFEENQLKICCNWEFVEKDVPIENIVICLKTGKKFNFFVKFSDPSKHRTSEVSGQKSVLSDTLVVT